MFYNTFCNLKISALGMGNMRLPVLDGDDSRIDEAAVAEMFDCAIENGVNYFDTAFGYHVGQSEIVVGKTLKRYPRDSFYLATKFPGYSAQNMARVREIFAQQLQKCGVDYFDFYLFHNVCESNIDMYLDRQYGVYDFLMEQKAKGVIRHLGFSAHANLDTMRRFLEAYGEGLEFCQLQINYLDWTFQNAKAKVELCKEYGLPVIVMEPVRGGKLAALGDAYTEKLRALRPDESTAAWAFRFIQTLPGILTTLSGMSDLTQLQENIRTFAERKPLNDAEMQALSEIADSMIHTPTLPCTRCRYCVEYCPQELDIPELLKMYNDCLLTGSAHTVTGRIEKLPDGKKPSACLGCRSCESVCPQQLGIADAMSDFAKKLSL